jgi:hypothetical protein
LTLPAAARSSGFALQRKCACGGSAGLSEACEGCDRQRLSLQRSTPTANAETRHSFAAPPIVHEVLRSPGQPLDAETRAFMEPHFSHNFSAVRVHTDARAAESAGKVNALAYTVGRDIAFAAGRYAPTTSAGRKLLAHELSHVVQQPSQYEDDGHLAIGEPGDASEREADQRADYVMEGKLSHAGRQDSQAVLRRSMPEGDPIHDPIVEDYRRTHGLPLEDESPGVPPIGPSAAEIKYYLNVPPPAASVFYVSFQNVAPPAVPDHSQQNPGPAGSTADHAGYTRVRLQKRASVAWETGAPAADGRIPLYAQSVNVFYRLDPIEFFVSSDYAVGSCPYRMTDVHERSHVEAFTRIFHEGRATLLQDLSGLAVPTRTAPALVDPANVTAFQDALGGNLRGLVVAHSARLVAQMDADRRVKDAPAAYATTYAQCPSADW